MCPVDIADTVEIESGGGTPEGIKITVEGLGAEEVPVDESNLVWKTAEAFYREAGLPMAGRFHLKKIIPSGGGLAGGSANGVCALHALNEIHGNPLNFSQLEAIAASVGSDTVYFLHRSAAICKGRGEIVEPVAVPHDFWVVLIHPGFGVSTPWAYKTYAQNSAQGPEGLIDLSWVTSEGREHSFKMRNDLEPPVLKKYLWIGETRNWLLKQTDVVDAMMSGSGATVFGVCEDEGPAKDLAAKARGYLGEQAWIQAVRLCGRRDTPFTPDTSHL